MGRSARTTYRRCAMPYPPATGPPSRYVASSPHPRRLARCAVVSNVPAGTCARSASFAGHLRGGVPPLEHHLGVVLDARRQGRASQTPTQARRSCSPRTRARGTRRAPRTWPSERRPSGPSSGSSRNAWSAHSAKPHDPGERKLDASDESLLVAMARSEPPEGRARWTMQLLADEMVRLTVHETVSDETIRRRFSELQLKPWLEKMWCVPKSGRVNEFETAASRI